VSTHTQASNGAEVAPLAALLLAVGRYSSLEAAYVSSRAPLIAAMWDEAAAMLGGSSGSSAQPPAAGSSGSSAPPAPGGHAPAAAEGATAGGLGGGWLLLLYSSLLALLEADAAWLGGCLPEQRCQLLAALARAAFDKVWVGGGWGCGCGWVSEGVWVYRGV
jgi:hypothetical protein